MDESDSLAALFERHRPRLRAVAYRMLGSLSEADDAVQNAWLRLGRAEVDRIDNLGAWLTTVVARECLHALRSRRHRREDEFGVRLPDVMITEDEGLDPEQEAVLADSVGLAMLVVLDTLTPAERLAFVLHDVFHMHFDDIAQLVGRSPVAARQLASRARRRVEGAEVPSPDVDVARQRQVVDAFFAASRAGRFDALVRLLDPEVVLRADLGPGRPAAVYRGVAQVARLARAPRGAGVRPVLVNGVVGVVVTIDGRPFSIMSFTVAGGRIVEIYGIRPDRARGLAPTSPPTA